MTMSIMGRVGSMAGSCGGCFLGRRDGCFRVVHHLCECENLPHIGAFQDVIHPEITGSITDASTLDRALRARGAATNSRHIGDERSPELSLMRLFHTSDQGRKELLCGIDGVFRLDFHHGHVFTSFREAHVPKVRDSDSMVQ